MPIVSKTVWSEIVILLYEGEVTCSVVSDNLRVNNSIMEKLD